MLGLSPTQLAYLLLGLLSTCVAWALAVCGRITAHRRVATFLSAVTAADVLGILTQWYVVGDAPYVTRNVAIQVARHVDMATYLGWPIALAVLGAVTFDGGKVGRMVGVGVMGIWAAMCGYLIATYPEVGDSVAVITSHKQLMDRLFTAAHVVGVGVGVALGARFYLQRRWPLLPHLTTSVLILGAVSDCAGQYAHASPSVDYDLSSVVGVVVHAMVNIIQGASVVRLVWRKR